MTTAAPFLRVYLFGGLRVERDEQVVIAARTPQQRAKALFAYLLLARGQYVPRDELVEALWPGAERVSPSRLKQTVLTLRRLIEPTSARQPHWQYIVQRAGAYAFSPWAAHVSDVEQFERELDLAQAMQAAGTAGQALAAYRRALRLWRGELLPELRHETWVRTTAERLNERRLEALDAAARLFVERGERERAIELLQQSVAADPLREVSCLELMRLLGQAGREAEARRVYERLRVAAARRLQVAPSPALTRLYTALRSEQRVDPDAAPA